MTIRKYQPLRRLAGIIQALVMLGLPFISIRGESALRFDVPSLRLLFFGTSLWMDEFFIVLIAIIFLTFLIVFITVLFGRIWCGWACPQTVLVDFTGFMDKTPSLGILYKLLSYAATFLVSAVVAASLIWYFVSPYEFFSRLVSASLGPVITWSWAIMTVILLLDLAFVRRRFCATVCPYSKVQSVLFDSATLVIAFDQRRADECMDCKACVRVCPVGIDIRKGGSSACVSCAECIDKCSQMTSRHGKPGLIGYFFGKPGVLQRLIRQNALLTGALTVFFLLFFVYLAATRVPLDMTVLPNYSYPPRFGAEGAAINSYLLTFENKSKQETNISLRVEYEKADARISPARIGLKAGEYRKVTVFVTAPARSAGSSPEDIRIVAVSETGPEVRLTKIAHFMAPASK